MSTKRKTTSKASPPVKSPRLWTTANLNDSVRFKLKPKGWQHVRELNRTHPVYSKYPLKYEPDKDGWIETMLWDFANIFGPTMGMGFDQTVETDILLRRCI